MSNYNERLDEILLHYSSKQLDADYEASDRLREDSRYEAKQALTSLIKELVAEAKPAKKDQSVQSTVDDVSRCRFYQYGGYNRAIDEFEQNLLKALEEL